MKFWRDNWFKIGLLIFIGLSFGMIFWGAAHLPLLQKLLWASLMALFIHQYEEYALPGGGPVVINRIFYGEETLYRHYPGNWQSIMIVNVSAWAGYALALAFPQALWLGTATMFFNLFQVLGHGLQMNVKMKTWYNPGMASAVLLFIPISVGYLAVVTMQGGMSALDWPAAVLGMAGLVLATVILPVQLGKDKDSPYDLPQRQVEQFEAVRRWASVTKEKEAS